MDFDTIAMLAWFVTIPVAVIGVVVGVIFYDISGDEAIWWAIFGMCGPFSFGAIAIAAVMAVIGLTANGAFNGLRRIAEYRKSRMAKAATDS